MVSVVVFVNLLMMQPKVVLPGNHSDNVGDAGHVHTLIGAVIPEAGGFESGCLACFLVPVDVGNLLCLALPSDLKDQNKSGKPGRSLSGLNAHRVEPGTTV